MLKFVIQLFNPKKQEKEARQPRPLRLKLSTNDSFGRALQQYNDSLSDSEKAEAKKLFHQLMRIGSDSEPPKNWRLVFRRQKIHIQQSGLHEYMINWWSILQKQQAECKITPANIPIARGIIWLYIHFQKEQSVTEILQFTALCQSHNKSSFLVNSKLANAAIDLLLNEHYFKLKERDIWYYYPNLLEGRIGIKLKRFWNRKRSTTERNNTPSLK